MIKWDDTLFINNKVVHTTDDEPYHDPAGELREVKCPDNVVRYFRADGSEFGAPRYRSPYYVTNKIDRRIPLLMGITSVVSFVITAKIVGAWL